ncbi:MAG: DNA-3-methyladenine glycosylase I [Casimicrobiaceae bacterium]
MRNPVRCTWAGTDPRMIDYHDTEWGVPVHDDRLLFEFLVLEGAQAGLSWQTILNKREGYRQAFANFDPVRVARFDRRRIEALLANPDIVRNRLKVESTVTNAQAVLEVQCEFSSFDRFLWSLINNGPDSPKRARSAAIPPSTPASDALSKALRQRGFRFVGTTICYAFMQATGMVNDHASGCFRKAQIK